MEKQLIEQYFANLKKVAAYNYALGIINWDNATFSAAKGGADIRNEHYSILSAEQFAFITSADYIDNVNALYNIKDRLEKTLKRSVELAKINLDSLIKIPANEYQEFALLCQESQSIWEKAKAEDNFSLFAPYLEKVLDYKIKFAHYEGIKNGSVYNTMLNHFEEGLTTAQLDKFFDLLKSELLPLYQQIRKSPKYKVNYLKKLHQKTYDIATQEQLSNTLLQLLGFDHQRGQLKTSIHPFSLSLSINDVRMTTRYDKHQLLSNIYSVIHETGHSLYTQNCDPHLIKYQLADGVSMAFHESQSRFMENVVGRSEAFVLRLYQICKKLFPKQFSDIKAEEFVLAVNRVENSKIRTEADELTYCLHILVRYEIEKKLVERRLSVKQLPTEWKRLMKEYLAVDIKNDQEGVLQDVHWSDGSFGYFPTYALGSAYASQIYYAICKDINFEKYLATDLMPIIATLKDRVHKYGALLPPAQLLKVATGEEFNEKYFIKYLKEKYQKIYDL